MSVCDFVYKTKVDFSDIYEEFLSVLRVTLRSMLDDYANGSISFIDYLLHAYGYLEIARNFLTMYPKHFTRVLEETCGDKKYIDTLYKTIDMAEYRIIRVIKNRLDGKDYLNDIQELFKLLSELDFLLSKCFGIDYEMC